MVPRKKIVSLVFFFSFFFQPGLVCLCHGVKIGCSEKWAHARTPLPQKKIKNKKNKKTKKIEKKSIKKTIKNEKHEKHEKKTLHYTTQNKTQKYLQYIFTCTMR